MSDTSSVKILIAFYSRNGSTEALAKAVADGVREAGGEPILRRAKEIVGPDVMAKVDGWKGNADRMIAAYGVPTEADAMGADAILFGTPTRFGNVSSELKAYVDSLGGAWFRGDLVGKVGGVFCSTQTTHGGNESTLLTMFNFMAHLGLVIVPTGYADPSTFQAGTPYGASTVSGQDNAPPTDKDVAVAKFQGKRTVEVARALKTAHQTAGR